MSELHEQLQELALRLDDIKARLERLEGKPVMLPIGHKRRAKSEGHVYDPFFDKFWEVYPRKVGKGAARKAWLRCCASSHEIVTAVEAQKRSEAWLKEDGRYIPNPATWLNQERWLDEVKGEPVVTRKIEVKRYARCTICGEGFNGMGDYCPRHNDPA